MSAKCQVSEAAVLEPKYKKPQPQTTEPFLRARFEQVLSPEQAPERKGDWSWEFEVVGGITWDGVWPFQGTEIGRYKVCYRDELGWNRGCGTVSATHIHEAVCQRSNRQDEVGEQNENLSSVDTL